MRVHVCVHVSVRATPAAKPLHYLSLHSTVAPMDLVTNLQHIDCLRSTPIMDSWSPSAWHPYWWDHQMHCAHRELLVVLWLDDGLGADGSGLLVLEQHKPRWRLASARQELIEEQGGGGGWRLPSLKPPALVALTFYPHMCVYLEGVYSAIISQPCPSPWGPRHAHQEGLMPPLMAALPPQTNTSLM